MPTHEPTTSKTTRPPADVELDSERHAPGLNDRGSWPPVVARVELAPGATVSFEFDGEEPDVLDPDTVTGLFQAGLHAAPRRRPGKSDGSARMVLDGEARFMVGSWDLGRKGGLKVVGRGLTYVLGVVDDADTARTTHAVAEPVPEPASSAERQTPPALSMSIAELAESFDEAVAHVLAGGRVTITEHEQPAAAVLVSWRWYCQQQELLARLDAAQWAAWEGGAFSADTYAAALRDLRSASTPAAGPGATTSPAGGDGDGR